jgi:hypothetical protein
VEISRGLENITENTKTLGKENQSEENCIMSRSILHQVDY